jgi:hypothetical protein
MYMMYLTLSFLLLRAMIQYLPMILQSPLSSLIALPYQLFACMRCMILPTIFPLWVVLEVYTGASPYSSIILPPSKISAATLSYSYGCVYCGIACSNKFNQKTDLMEETGHLYSTHPLTSRSMGLF